MALSTKKSKINISNNSFLPGVSVSASNVTTTHRYSVLLTLGADAVVDNNLFSGVLDDQTNSSMIRLSTSSNIITNNKFARNTSNISAYIRFANALAGKSNIITDNIFDSPTTNGTSEDLVLNLPYGCIYERNINQTGYTTLSIKDGQFRNFLNFFNGAPPTTLVPDNTQISTLRNYGATVNDNPIGNIEQFIFKMFNASLTGTQNSWFSSNISINKFLPNNTTLLEAVIGLCGDVDPGTPTTGSSFAYPSSMVLSAQKTQSSTYTYASPDTSMADVKYQLSNDLGMTGSPTSSTLTISNGTDVTNFLNSTKYLKLDLSSLNYDIKQNNNIILNLTYNLSLATTNSTTTSIVINSSPILIKYRW